MLVFTAATARSVRSESAIWGRLSRPSDSDTATEMSSTAAIEVATVASAAPAQTVGSICVAEPATAWKTITAMQLPSRNCPKLKARRMGGRRRWTARTSSRPIAPARITSWPEANTSANTSGISPRDMEWALRRKWTWTTKRSAAAKATSRIQMETCIDGTTGRVFTAPELSRAIPAGHQATR